MDFPLFLLGKYSMCVHATRFLIYLLLSLFFFFFWSKTIDGMIIDSSIVSNGGCELKKLIIYQLKYGLIVFLFILFISTI